MNTRRVSRERYRKMSKKIGVLVLISQQNRYRLFCRRFGRQLIMIVDWVDLCLMCTNNTTNFSSKRKQKPETFRTGFLRLVSSNHLHTLTKMHFRMAGVINEVIILQLGWGCLSQRSFMFFFLISHFSFGYPNHKCQLTWNGPWEN